jgi:hypothetical protein
MQIETKLNIGDTAFFLNENKVCIETVVSIKVTINTYSVNTYSERLSINTIYTTNTSKSINEDKVFSTKQELLESL